MADEGMEKGVTERQRQAAQDIYDGNEKGTNGPPNSEIQRSNKDVFESGKEGAAIAVDTNSYAPPGVAVGPGAKPANTVSLAKEAAKWFTRIVNWVGENGKEDNKPAEDKPTEDKVQPPSNNQDKDNVPKPKISDEPTRNVPE